MRKLSLIILLIFFLVSCVSIDERYTDRRVVVKPTYQVVQPIYGFSLWNPFWYYRAFGYYYGYYGSRNRVYLYYGNRVYGRSVITKRQLRSPPAGKVSRTRVKKTSIKAGVVKTGSSKKVKKEKK